MQHSTESSVTESFTHSPEKRVKSLISNEVLSDTVQQELQQRCDQTAQFIAERVGIRDADLRSIQELLQSLNEQNTGGGGVSGPYHQALKETILPQKRALEEMVKGMLPNPQWHVRVFISQVLAGDMCTVIIENSSEHLVFEIYERGFVWDEPDCYLSWNNWPMDRGTTPGNRYSGSELFFCQTPARNTQFPSAVMLQDKSNIIGYGPVMLFHTPKERQLRRPNRLELLEVGVSSTSYDETGKLLYLRVKMEEKTADGMVSKKITWIYDYTQQRPCTGDLPVQVLVGTNKIDSFEINPNITVDGNIITIYIPKKNISDELPIYCPTALQFANTIQSFIMGNPPQLPQMSA